MGETEKTWTALGDAGLIRDRYQPIGVMGRGGQGEVLQALDTQHGRPVALKIRPVPDAEARDAILAEARILLSLGAHPNLPLVREDFFWSDRYVLVMDWVQGTDLGRLLVETGDPGLHVTSVIGWLAQAADALGYLHPQGVVHGDVKPANLVLTPDGRIVLVDFGISRRPGDGSGPLLGSPGYSAPELGAGDAITPASDVYGLAATAVALLTGSPPVGGRPEWEGVPNAPAIERALRRGLAVDPSRRPRTATELVERLRAHVSLDYPTGVVTFMLTDIEGSTALWESDPDAMADRLVAHDEIIADSVESNGGRLLKARGEGDSTFSVFTRASDAVAAALSTQRSLGGTGLPVRVAIHTGEAQGRAGDYFGRAVNRASRLRAIARGGQVLLSAATAELAMETLPVGAHLTDLGFRELRDMSRGEQVFALTHTDLSPVAPTMPMAPAPAPAVRAPQRRPASPAPPAPPVAAPMAPDAPTAPPSALPQPELTRAAAPDEPTPTAAPPVAVPASAPPAPPAGLAPSGPGRQPPLPPALAVLRADPFVGRDSERARLREAWDDVMRGVRRVVLVSGEPGIGKTQLAAETAGERHDQGAVVLHGRCDEGLQVPYQPFAAALAQALDDAAVAGVAPPLGRLAAELTRLAPDLTDRVPGIGAPMQADPDTEQYRLFDAVAGWLTATAAATPTVLVLDDLHWATRATLHLLRHVVRVAESSRLLIVATYRDTELGRNHPLNELLADFHRMTGVERIALHGLGDDEVVQLIDARVGHPVGRSGRALAARIRAETDGNPFFAHELVRHLVDSGALDVDRDGSATPSTGPPLAVPEGVREVVGRRLARLSDAAGRVLELAAVVGVDFELPVVAAAGGLDEDEALVAIEEAVASRLVNETGPLRFRFAHNLVRATILSAMARARRTRAHRRVAEAIELLHADDLDAQMVALARHYAEAATAGGASKAYEYAMRAGALAAGRLAHDEAVECYRLARELMALTANPVDEQSRCRLLLALGDAQRRAGDPEARVTLLEAGGVALRWRDAELAGAAALATAMTAETVAGAIDVERVRLLEAALALNPSPDSPTRARLLGSLAIELAWQPGSRRDQLADEALAIARRADDPATLAWVLVARAKVMSPPHDAGVRQAAAAELTALAAELEDPQVRLHALLATADAAIGAGRFGDADRALVAAADLATEVHQPALRWLVLAALARQAAAAGRFAEAERLADDALDAAPDGQSDPPLVHLGQRLLLRSLQGRIDEVAEQVGAAAADNPEISPFVIGDLLGAIARGDDTVAARRLVELAADDVAGIARNQSWLVGSTLAAVVAFRLGDAVTAASLLEQLRPYRAQWAVDRAAISGPVAAAVGCLAATLARWDEADVEFEAAVAAADAAGARPWAAVARFQWAIALSRRGDADSVERAARLLADVVAVAAELGMAEVLTAATAIANALEAPARRRRDAVMAGEGVVDASAIDGADRRRAADPSVPAGHCPPLAGRTAELARLEALWRSVAAGGRRFVLITGAPGAGKTRLAAELAAIAAAGGAVVLSGRSDAGPQAPYQPFVAILRDLVAAGMVPGPLDGEIAHLLAPPAPPSLSGGTHPRPAAPAAGAEGTDPSVERHRLFLSAARVLDTAAAGRPLVLVLDDLHVADQPSIQLARHLVERPGSGGLLVLATADTVPPATTVDLGLDPDAVDRVHLSGLTETEAAPLVVDRLGLASAAGAEELIAELVAVTAGNPLFLGELVDHLTASAQLEVVDGRLVTAPGRARPVTGPDGLRRVVAARLAALPTPSMRVLAVGAVLAGDFTGALVRAMVDDDGVVDAALASARAAGLIVETAAGGPRYSFSHSVIRDVVYDALTPVVRQRLHVRAAQAIEASVPAERLLDHAPALAAHYREAGIAGDPDHAVEWSIRAGDQAARVFAFDEAAAQFEAAAVTLSRLGGAANELRRARLLERLASLRFFTGSDPGAATRTAADALELYERHGDTTRAAKVHSQLGTYFVTVGAGAALDIDRALHHFEAAEPVLAHRRDRAAGYFHVGVANASMRALQLDAVEKAAATALEIAQEQRVRGLWANAALLAGLARWERGELAAGGVLIERAWRVADVLDQPVLTMLTSWNRGNQHVALDELEAAVGWYERDVATERFADAPRAAAIMAANVDRCRFELGRLDEVSGDVLATGRDAVGAWAPAIANGPPELAAGRLDELIADARKAGDRWSLLWHVPSVVAAFRALGAIDRAADLATEGVELAVATGAVVLEVLARLEQAHVLAAMGRPGDAGAAVARARSVVGDGRHWGNVGDRVVHADAVASSAAGRFADADLRFQRALDGVRTSARPWAEAAVLADWGRSLTGRGDHARATGRFEQAAYTYRRIGAAPHWTDPLVADTSAQSTS